MTRNNVGICNTTNAPAKPFTEKVADPDKISTADKTSQIIKKNEP